MLLQPPSMFGLFARSVVTEIPAALAIALHVSPDCTTVTVVQSLPSRPKQRSSADVALAQHTEESAQRIMKLYLIGEDVVTSSVDGVLVGIGQLEATVDDDHQKVFPTVTTKLHTWIRCRAQREYRRCHFPERCRCESSPHAAGRTQRSRTWRRR